MPKFKKTFCSQCGGEFGPGDSGYSHCQDHEKVECPSCKAHRDNCRLCGGSGVVTERQALDFAPGS